TWPNASRPCRNPSAAPEPILTGRIPLIHAPDLSRTTGCSRVRNGRNAPLPAVVGLLGAEFFSQPLSLAHAHRASSFFSRGGERRRGFGYSFGNRLDRFAPGGWFGSPPKHSLRSP